eukprot:scaffold35467_cov199-Amphora_coffeaeformis.AAC.7
MGQNGISDDDAGSKNVFGNFGGRRKADPSSFNRPHTNPFFSHTPDCSLNMNERVRKSCTFSNSLSCLTSSPPTNDEVSFLQRTYSGHPKATIAVCTGADCRVELPSLKKASCLVVPSRSIRDESTRDPSGSDGWPSPPDIQKCPTGRGKPNRITCTRG